MAEVNIGNSVTSLKVPAAFSPWGTVVYDVSNSVQITSGTGRELKSSNPLASQEAADLLAAKLNGKVYQPFTAKGARIDATYTIGDTIKVGGVTSRIYNQHIRFGGSTISDVSAPADEEVDHEYPYVPAEDRRITREIGGVKAQLEILDDRITAEVSEVRSAAEEIKSSLTLQSDRIDAKVSSSGGNASEFGWTLVNDSFTLTSSGTDVMKATKNGIRVTGEIRATSGTIGGFTITQNSLTYGGQTWGGTIANGIYIGPNGIQLGANFKVDSSGNITAQNADMRGNIYCDNLYVRNNYGGYDTISTPSIAPSLTGGYAFGNAVNSGSGSYPGFFRSVVVNCDSLTKTMSPGVTRTLGSKLVSLDGEIVTVAIWS